MCRRSRYLLLERSGWKTDFGVHVKTFAPGRHRSYIKVEIPVRAQNVPDQMCEQLKSRFEHLVRSRLVVCLPVGARSLIVVVKRKCIRDIVRAFEELQG